MKKVIVTGASGFIGGSLVRELLKKNYIVYGISRKAEHIKEFVGNTNFNLIVADLFKDDFSKLIDDDIDVFYHLAWDGGFTTAIRDYKVQMQNASCAGDMIMMAKKVKCKKFVYSGTYNQYEIRNFLKTEKFEPRYTCIYSTGKTAASLICRTLAFNLGIEYSAGLVPMPYGEYNYSKQLTNIVINQLNQGISPKLIKGDNLYDLVYIQDIVNAFIAIGEKGVNQREYYIGHRNLKTFRDWMEEIRDTIAPDVDLKFGEFKDNQNIDYSMIDLDALYRDTGFECKADFRETIRKTAEWVERHSKSIFG